MANFEKLYSGDLDVQLNSNDSNTLYTTARRQAAINEGLEEFADLTECLIRQSSVSVSCNVSEYMLLSSGTLAGSTDYTRLASQGVEYQVKSSNGAWLTQISGKDFPRRDIEWLNSYDCGWRQSTTPMTPTGYYLRPEGGNVYFGLNRKPTVGSSQHAKLTIPYVARPAPMASTGEIPFTVNSSVRYDLTVYHKALPHYAASILLPLIGDMEGSQRQFTLFMSYVTRFLQAMRPKGGQHITTSKNYLQDARRGRGRDAYYSPTVPPGQWQS